MFADDTVVYTNGNQSQFKCVFDIFTDFGNRSGCKFNLSKSSAFYIGSSRSITFKPFCSKGLLWSDVKIKYLGVFIPINNSSEQTLFKENFNSHIEEVQSVLNFWSARGLTILGKIIVLKSLIIPKIVYKASYLPVILLDLFFKQLKRVMFYFIWGLKWEKIGRFQLCCAFSEGGAKMIDVVDSFLLA